MGILQNIARVLKFAPADIKEGRTILIQRDPIGSSGTEVYSGYFTEEYLQALRSYPGVKIYDKMRRQDPQIKMCLSAVKSPIMSAKWSVEPGEQDAEYQKHADLVEHELFNGYKPFRQILQEVLSMVDMGHSIFEVSHKVVMGHPEFGDYNGIKSFGFRSQKTIESWQLDRETGELAGVTQYAYGDLQRTVQIPGRFLVVFSLDKEGDNYEGISWLRACYGPWFRKQMYTKLMGIGIEKYAVPTPVGGFPSGQQSSQQYLNFVETLKAYTTHEQNFITLPKTGNEGGDWSIDFPAHEFDPEKTMAAIEGENKEIANAFMANFMDLGVGGNTGAFALAKDKSDFFLGALQHLGYLICETMNERVIKPLVEMNYGPQMIYPRLTVSGIVDKAGKEFAEVVTMLVGSKVITPDEKLEAHLRERYEMPEADLESRRKPEVPPMLVAPGAGNEDTPKKTPNAEATEDPEDEEAAKELSSRDVLVLAEKKARSQIKEGTDLLKGVITDGLDTMARDFIDRLMVKVRAESPSRWPGLINTVELRGLSAYKMGVQDSMAQISSAALEQARKEVPKAKGVKLSDEDQSFRLGEFERLPKKVQKRLVQQSQTLVEAEAGDLMKAVTFRFNGSVVSTDSPNLIEADLNEAANEYINGPATISGASINAAAAVNEARQAFFFDDEVLSEIESFTFVNGDPVSPICQDLAGTTFKADDPTANRYWPPLHHNAVLTGTMILTGLGDVPVEKIKVGDHVLTHGGRWMPVTEWMDRFEDKEYFVIEMEDGKSIEITGEHPVLTGRGWVRVDSLTPADNIVCLQDINYAGPVCDKPLINPDDRYAAFCKPAILPASMDAALSAPFSSRVNLNGDLPIRKEEVQNV